MAHLPLRPPPLTVDAIIDAFPEGVFGVSDSPVRARFAGHGWGSDPEGVTQVDLGYEHIRVETAQERELPLSLVVNELIFQWLTEAQLTFPLTLRIERYECSIPIDATPAAFDAYALDGQVLAVAALDDVRVSIRCSEAALAEVKLTRLDRLELDQIAAESHS